MYGIRIYVVGGLSIDANFATAEVRDKEYERIFNVIWNKEAGFEVGDNIVFLTKNVLWVQKVEHKGEEKE